VLSVRAPNKESDGLEGMPLVAYDSPFQCFNVSIIIVPSSGFHNLICRFYFDVATGLAVL
jgi:hypothetical protein